MNWNWQPISDVYLAEFAPMNFVDGGRPLIHSTPGGNHVILHGEGILIIHPLGKGHQRYDRSAPDYLENAEAGLAFAQEWLPAQGFTRDFGLGLEFPEE